MTLTPYLNVADAAAAIAFYAEVFGAVPRGEAFNVHRGGGRFISIIGSNALFHNTRDCGAETVDLDVIERFAGAFATAATSLART